MSPRPGQLLPSPMASSSRQAPPPRWRARAKGVTPWNAKFVESSQSLSAPQACDRPREAPDGGLPLKRRANTLTKDDVHHALMRSRLYACVRICTMTGGLRSSALVMQGYARTTCTMGIRLPLVAPAATCWFRRRAGATKPKACLPAHQPVTLRKRPRARNALRAIRGPRIHLPHRSSPPHRVPLTVILSGPPVTSLPGAVGMR